MSITDHNWISPDEFQHTVTRPRSAAELPKYSQPHVYEGGARQLNSLQDELDRHPNG